MKFSRRLGRAILYPFVLLSLMWGSFLLQAHGWFSGCFGAIIPLSPEGLKGVLLSPLLHGSLDHIISNSIPIALLSFLLFYFYSRIARQVLSTGWLAAGLLVWLLPPVDIYSGDLRYTCIVGASGVVYVLAFFLFFSGIFRRERGLLAISLMVALYYGSLIWGIFPEEYFIKMEQPSRISWQSHLAGALVGIVLAYIYRNTGSRRRRYIWEYPGYYSERDDRLWQDYKARHPEDFESLPQKPEEDIWKYLDELRRR